MSPLSAAVMQAVDPLLVSPGISVAHATSGGGILNRNQTEATQKNATNSNNVRFLMFQNFFSSSLKLRPNKTSVLPWNVFTVE
jgi:hypothetical protein